MLDWLKRINWRLVLAVLASSVVYFAGWVALASLFLFLFGTAFTFSYVLLLCWVGAFMTLGRDMFVKPLADAVRNWIAPSSSSNEK